MIYNGVDYSDLKSVTARTIRFICREKWECPICYEMTKISHIRCDNCHQEMGINKFRFEARLSRICPKGIWDEHKLAK